MRRVLALELVIAFGIVASACGGITVSAHKALTTVSAATTTVPDSTTTSTSPAPATTTTVDPCREHNRTS